MASGVSKPCSGSTCSAGRAIRFRGSSLRLLIGHLLPLFSHRRANSEGLERAAAELVRGTNLEPRDLVRGLLAGEGDRQALEGSFALIQHNLENGVNTLQVHFAESRNTADARLVARAPQRLSKAPLTFNEDPYDQSRLRIAASPNRAELSLAANDGACHIDRTAAVISCCVSSLVRRQSALNPRETHHEHMSAHLDRDYRFRRARSALSRDPQWRHADRKHEEPGI